VRSWWLLAQSSSVRAQMIEAFRDGNDQGFSVIRSPPTQQWPVWSFQPLPQELTLRHLQHADEENPGPSASAYTVTNMDKNVTQADGGR